MSSKIALKAFAKLNLALAVGPPAPPKGYHPIASWFVPIELHDDLSVTRLEPGAASTYEILWAADAPRPTPIDWPLEKDLAVRAHRLLEQQMGRGLPVSLVLRKRVPTGGGLGGGSSDAAAMLVAVNRLFDLGLSSGGLAEWSRGLGSDIAFFVDDDAEGDTPRPAMVGGFGERIERVGRVSGEVLLIFPPFGCPTADVYRAFDGAPSGNGADEGRVRRLIERSLRVGRVEAGELFNDLAPAAFAVAPQLRELADGVIRPVLREESARLGVELTLHMTGSGSTLFVVLPRGCGGLADRVMARLHERALGVSGVSTHIH